MGKRELALIIGFIAAGVIVWQVTAPKAEGGGFSIGRLISEARREMRPRNASAEITTTPSIPIDASINELRLTLSGEVIIRAEDRAGIGAELNAVSDGVDEAEARQLAGEVGLKVSRFGDSVVVGWQFPDPGRQRPRLTLLVPARLRIQIEGRGTAEISGVESVTLARQTGEAKLTSIQSAVKGESRGTVTIDGADTVDLSIANNETSLKGVRGDVRLNVRAGEVRMTNTTGRVYITGTDADVRMDGVGGELRVELADGELELTSISAPIDIDARSMPVTAAWLRAASAKIQVRDGNLDLTLPQDAASYSLDVRAAGGELRLPDRLRRTMEGQDSVVTKSGGANAPSIFVRSTGATVAIR